MSARDAKILFAVADAVSWDDRKDVARIFQMHGGIVTGSLDDMYPALLEVARYGAQRAAENLLEDE